MIYEKHISGSFPVPFGDYEDWTPLVYGANTLSMYHDIPIGYNSHHSIHDIDYVSRYGRIIDGNWSNNWVKIEKPTSEACRTGNRIYNIYILKTGTVQAPVNVIDRVVLKCEAPGDKNALFIASFFEYPQNIEHKIGKFPIGLIRIPTDFFFPFIKSKPK